MLTLKVRVGFVSNDDQIDVRHTSASTDSTVVNTLLKVGGVLPSNRAFSVSAVSDTFSSTTASEVIPDTTPNAFIFTDQLEVGLSTIISSNSITISGIDATTNISITGGEFSINSGTFSNTSSTVENGDIVAVQHTSASTFSTSTETVLTIGGIQDTFTSTTSTIVATDTIPDAFTFTDLSDENLMATVSSNNITVTGIDTATEIRITGGQFSINEGAYSDTPNTVKNGDIVKVQHTTASTPKTAVDTVLSIGGVSDTFTSVTAPETSTISSVGGGTLDFYLLIILSALIALRKKQNSS